MANQASINATPEQKAFRSVGRVQRLQQAIEKAAKRGDKERVTSLTAEYDRRMAEIKEMKEALDSV